MGSQANNNTCASQKRGFHKSLRVSYIIYEIIYVYVLRHQ